MFQKGQTVECVDHKMPGIGNILENGNKYIVLEFIPPEKCTGGLASHPAEWAKNGGRVKVDKYPDCYWYGRRFKTVA